MSPAARILCGTASWADKPLLDSGFYPQEVTSAEERLRFYAAHFPLVEADTTYYGLPRDDVTRHWAERTPESFTFDVKAFALFTGHPAAMNRLPGELREMLPAALAAKKNLYRTDAPREALDYAWAAFTDGLMPLHNAGKLGVVVFQFPKWVFPSRATWTYVEEIRDRLGPFRGAFEFRNDVWMRADNRETTLARLGDLDFSYVCVDEPQGFTSSVPPFAAATNGLALVRFHGRNRETWERRTKTAAERFDYWYRPEELDEWVPAFRELAQAAGAVHAVMNTNNHDQGPRNVALLQARLAAAGFTLPEWPPAG